MGFSPFSKGWGPSEAKGAPEPTLTAISVSGEGDVSVSEPSINPSTHTPIEPLTTWDAVSEVANKAIEFKASEPMEEFPEAVETVVDPDGSLEAIISDIVNQYQLGYHLGSAFKAVLEGNLSQADWYLHHTPQKPSDDVCTEDIEVGSINQTIESLDGAFSVRFTTGNILVRILVYSISGHLLHLQQLRDMVSNAIKNLA